MNIFNWLGIVVLGCGVISLLNTVAPRTKKIVSWIIIICGFFMSCNDYLFGQWVEDTITSGGSFCYLTVEDIDSVHDVGNTGVLKMYHKGAYPIHNIEFMVTNWDGSDQFKRNFILDGNFNNIDEMPLFLNTWTKMGPIYPDSIAVLDPVFLLGDERRLVIVFNDGNSSYKQDLHLKKVKGEWVSKTKVVRGFGNEVLYEKTHTVQ